MLTDTTTVDHITIDDDTQYTQDSNDINADVDANNCSFPYVYELRNHSSINSKNLKAMMIFEESIKNQANCAVSSYLEKSQPENKLTFKRAIVSSKEQIIETMNQKSEQTQKNNNLKNSIKKIETEIQEVSSGKKSQRFDYKHSLNAFKIAEKFHATNFSLKVKVKNSTDNTYSAVVYFEPDEKESSVTFHMSHEGEIISFDASTFLHEKQEKLLQSRFIETGNVPALMCTLRKIALRK